MGLVGGEACLPVLLFLLLFSHVLCPIDSGCDSVTDTEPEDERALPFSKHTDLPLETSPGNLMVVQPDRIRCGVSILGTWYIKALTFPVDAFVSVKGCEGIMIHLIITTTFLWDSHHHDLGHE